mmetsp:Transcript_14323/g.36077  ORF Transcript_14323/g.36077 Transcript_14323/m.36077 type:complete len:242 (-) Transcript_14323:294-1019(-)
MRSPQCLGRSPSSDQVRRTGARGRQREAEAPLHPIELHVVHARVHDGVLGGGQGLHVAELDAVQAHGPPSRQRDVDPSEVARDVRRVDATEDQLTRRVVRQVESEDRPVELPRVHQSLQHSEARAAREQREAKPQDAVEGEAVPTLDATRVANLSKGEVGQGQLADAQGVLAEHAADVTGAIGQCKTLVQQSTLRRGSTGLVERSAVAGLPIGHPQIRRASVKDHANILAGRAEADRTIVA